MSKDIYHLPFLPIALFAVHSTQRPNLSSAVLSHRFVFPRVGCFSPLPCRLPAPSSPSHGDGGPRPSLSHGSPPAAPSHATQRRPKRPSPSPRRHPSGTTLASGIPPSATPSSAAGSRSPPCCRRCLRWSGCPSTVSSVASLNYRPILLGRHLYIYYKKLKLFRNELFH